MGLPTANVLFRALIYASPVLQMPINNRFLSGIKKEKFWHISLEGMHYLSKKKKDGSGFSSQYGWIHALRMVLIS